MSCTPWAEVPTGRLIRVGLFSWILVSCLLDARIARAVKLEIAPASTSSATMTVSVFADSELQDSDGWSSASISLSGASVEATYVVPVTQQTQASAGASIESLAIDASPDPGVRFVNKEIYHVISNVKCWANEAGYIDPTTNELVLIATSFSCGVGVHCSVVWDLLPSTDEEQPGDPVIVSIGPIGCRVGASSWGSTTNEGISDLEFGVPGVEMFGSYEVSPSGGSDVPSEGVEIHAHIGDQIKLTYRAQSGAVTLEGADQSGFDSTWQGGAIELHCPAKVFPAIIAPDVVGKTHLEAENAFEAAGFIAGLDIPTCSTAVPAGSVVAQEPLPGTWVPYSLQGATLYLSGALVPNVVGMSGPEAEGALVNANLVEGTVTGSCEGTALPLGTIVAQSKSPFSQYLRQSRRLGM